MTPGIQVLLGAPPIVALATPLPVIFPTALAGALTYRRRGEIDAACGGLARRPRPRRRRRSAPGSRTIVDTRLLLLVTAVLLGWQAIAILRGSAGRATEPRGRRRPRSSEGSGPPPASCRGSSASAAAS